MSSGKAAVEESLISGKAQENGCWHGEPQAGDSESFALFSLAAGKRRKGSCGSFYRLWNEELKIESCMYSCQAIRVQRKTNSKKFDGGKLL